jgi:hypothetical protein
MLVMKSFSLVQSLTPMSPMYSGHNAMIDPDDDKYGLGLPSDRALDLFIGVGWILVTIALSYIFTR